VYCIRCGTPMQDNQPFCASCGAPARGPVPLMPHGGRIAGHVRLLGIFWIAISAFRLLPGLFLTSMFHHHMGFLPPDVPPFVPGFLRGIGMLFLLGAVLGLAAGLGLLQRQPWARMLAIVLGCINLVDMPFGTALGIYTLWVLLPAKSEEEYRSLANSGSA
jgi:hypothetical protein